jgi:hypothetical protein
MELSDEELCAAMDEWGDVTEDDLGAAMDQCMDMDPAEDEELCAAMDYPTPPLVRADLPGWKYAPERARDLMANRPDTRELHDLIDEIHPIHTWPDVHYKYFYGLAPLNSKGRYTMAAFFWYNGINPDWAIKWFRFIGAFVPPKDRREQELRSVIDSLNKKVRSADGRGDLGKWHVFDMDWMQWVPCWEPTKEMLRGVNNMYIHAERPRVPAWADVI